MKLTGKTEDLTAYHCREENYYYKQGRDLVDDHAAIGITSQSDQPLSYVTVHGKLCDDLGFTPGQKISEQDFNLLLAGRDKDGNLLGKQEHKVHGIDLTFSAPKTVSIAGLVIKDADVIYAHKQAVQETMKEIEAFAFARPTSTSKHHTGKMIWAQVDDGFSREKDPHLHTHCILMNLTEHNGKVMALDGREILKRDFYKFFDALYKQRLEERLSDIHYDITYTKAGEWRLDRISRKAEEVLSTRAAQIEASEREGASHDRAWRKTRKDKEPGVNKPAVLNKWQEAMRRYNTKTEAENKRDGETWRKEWSEQAVYSIEAEQERTVDRANLTDDERWQLAIRRATQNEATASTMAIMTEFLYEKSREGKHKGYSFDEVRKEFDRQVEQGRIVQVDNHYTSWEMIRAEREYIAVAQEKTKAVGLSLRIMQNGYELLCQWGDEQRKAGGKVLSPTQLSAAQRILTSDDMLVVVQGDAGAGKTTALKAVADIYKKQGVHVIGLAMQGVTAQNLENEAGIRSMTLKSFYSGANASAGANRVLIVDEASMLDSRTANRLFKTAKHKGDKVVLVGDRNQLESVASGRVFERLVEVREREGKLVEMNENFRQRDEGLREAVDFARKGQMADSLNILERRGDITEIENKFTKDKDISIAKDRREAVAKHYDKDTLIIAGSVLARDELNSIIRANLIKQSELDIKKERTYDLVRTDVEGINQERKLKLTAGDVITFTKNEYKEYDVRNGERAKISKLPALNKHTLIVETEDKRYLEIDTRKYKNIDYGYALTTYKAQGQTYNKVVVEADTSSGVALNDMRSQYVNITRARDSVKIYTDDKESLKEYAEILAHKRDTLDKIDITLEQALQSEERLKERARENVLQTHKEIVQEYSRTAMEQPGVMNMHLNTDRLQEVKAEIDIFKKQHGSIKDDNPLIQELKTLQGRKAGETTRRTHEQTPREPLLKTEERGKFEDNQHTIIDKRHVLRFNEHGEPVRKYLNISTDLAVKSRLQFLREKEGITNPIIVVGDLAGMKTFNDKYGRDITDGVIESAVGLFAKEFHGTGAVVGSPSGDEMWGVPDQKDCVEKTIVKITNYVKKLNDMDYKLSDGNAVGLNAKFYIGRKKFADVEKHLKYHPETNEKLPAGTIVVEGELLCSEKDVVIKPTNVSSESIIYKNTKENTDALKNNNSLTNTESAKNNTTTNARVFTRGFTR